jgi:hypothetical protein
MQVKYKDLKPLGMRKPPLPTIFLRYNAVRFGDYIVITTHLNKAGVVLSWLSLPLFIVINIGNVVHEVIKENSDFVCRECIQRDETGRTEKNKDAFDVLMKKLKENT